MTTRQEVSQEICFLGSNKREPPLRIWEAHNKVNMSQIEEAFRGLGRTEKAKFVSQNIDYANAEAVAKYVSGYLFDVLNDVGDDEYIAAYLREKGYEVTKQE